MSPAEKPPAICETCRALREKKPRPALVRVGGRGYCPKHAEPLRRIVAAIAEAAMEMKAVSR